MSYALHGRILWSREETDDFINILKTKRYINRILASRKQRKWPIFDEVRLEMEKNGHDKTTKQLIFKYKNLLSMYRACKRHGKKSAKDKQYEFFDKMSDLFNNLNEQEYENLVDYEESSSANTEESNYVEQKQQKIQENAVKSISNSYKRKNSEEYIEEHLDDDDDGDDETWKPGPSKKTKITSSSKEIPQNDDDEIDQEEIDSFISKDRPTSDNYVRCVNYMVKSFAKTQLELQNKFYIQQIKLQEQQQEWEERILDEEREFFTKVLKQYARPREES